MRYFLFYFLLHLIHATPQINLYQTHSSTGNNPTQHLCLRLAAAIEQWNINRQIISYCLTHSLLDYHLQEQNSFPRLSFAQLSQANITTEQLYHWSASIDLIEDYQFYLDQTSTSIWSTLGKTLFYNCTLPRFGPFCQYQFDFHHANHTSLHEMINDFYPTFPYEPTEFTCYKHLKCDRGPDPLCLDWSEICDGKIDCSNGGIDEEHCWKLEVNECGEDEYRCLNGQCIPRSFYLDDPITPDCLDQTDEQRVHLYLNQKCSGKEPSMVCTDIACTSLPLTSCCLPERTQLIVNALFSIKDVNVSDECWSAFKCFLNAPIAMDPACTTVCESRNLSAIIIQTCPEMLLIPAVPVLFNEVYFGYMRNDLENLVCGDYFNPFRCFSITSYDNFFPSESRRVFNTKTCAPPPEFPHPTFGSIILWLYSYVIPTFLDLYRYNFLSNYSSAICNRSSMYQCLNSPKCISVSRLINGIADCPHEDDETVENTKIIESMKRNYFFCQTKKKYVPLTAVEDGKCDCGYADDAWCEDENIERNLIKRHISFQTICDGYVELLPIIIDGRNETDETECEQWLCDNTYTRCDRVWNCPNGDDEIGCYQPASLSCSLDRHLCVLNYTLELVCLPADKVNNGHIDCIGATDESSLCHKPNAISQSNNFYCVTNRSTQCLNVYSLCDNRINCIYEDDERFCRRDPSLFSTGTICRNFRFTTPTEVEKFLCDYTLEKSKQQMLYFRMNQTIDLFDDRSIDRHAINAPSKSWIDPSLMPNLNCHRGLDLRIWSNDQLNLSNTTCLCPPTYYGDRCQYQNQRIILSIQFRVSSDAHQTPFAILISLIDRDNKRLIHSHEQFTYLSVRDCKVKFSFYLLYSSRPKHSNKQYSIHIDIYDKQSLTHRSSALMLIRFPFLPVHRLSYIVDIPAEHQSIQTCLIDECDHGRCLCYSHSPKNNTFCQCNRGWTGRSCSIPHVCQCAEDAVCAGIDVNNRSVCVCPLHRFGPRCLLHHTVCSTNNMCKNGGSCIPNDEFTPFAEKFTCICPKGYIGKRCETIENGILLSFEPNIISTSSVFIHFIRLINDEHPERATTLRTIPFRQESLLVHWSQPFHLVFVEFPIHNYYFILAQNTYNKSTVIEKTIRASCRCRHIHELFNDTVVQLHLLRRIKYYQIPCQRDAPDLMCFYDDVHLCLCQDHRRHHVANCFEFDHKMTFNCLGQSVCQNDAQCFQDSPTCPRRSMCICPSCYYGTRCQFTTNVFSLSLDAILGYHIQPSVGLTKQPLIVQISVVLTIIFVIAGLINGIVALMTFKSKLVRNVGCGCYLLGTSIITLLITVMFGLKFWILLLSQTQAIVNRSFLSFQCHSIDFILRCSLQMDQWLNACVAVERAITMVKGARFDREISRRIAKRMTCIILLIIVATAVGDPIHRQLIGEENEDERRIWCVVSYSSTMQTFNTTMNIFHFVTPFLLNILSAIVLIVQKSRQKASLENDRTYNQILRTEIRQYKHLLIAPVILVILAVPHLILSFVSRCMKFNSNSWLFLILYFISLIPPMITFVIFILPSEFYKRELRTAVSRYRRNVTRRANTIGLRSMSLR